MSRAVYVRERRAELHRRGLCADGCGRKAVKGGWWCKAHGASRAGALKTWRTKLKLEVFETYGGAKCSCKGCPEHKHPHVEFLTINHINGGGAKHRRSMGGIRVLGGGFTMGGTTMYAWLRKHKYPKGFNVLCWNCQWGVHLNKGKCPHTKKE